MAGIHHGPFRSIKDSVVIRYVETARARELFDFNAPTSTVSRSYHEAIKALLAFGVRFRCVVGWLDPVVPV